MTHLTRNLASFLVVLALTATSAWGQPDYRRAERLLPWNTARLISGDSVRPVWYPDGNRFWYRNKTATGAEWVVVDPIKNTKALLFENARLAAAMSTARDTAYDPGRMPFAAFKFTNDGTNVREIEFQANKKRFVCDITVYRCAVSDTLPSELTTWSRPTRSRRRSSPATTSGSGPTAGGTLPSSPPTGSTTGATASRCLGPATSGLRRRGGPRSAGLQIRRSSWSGGRTSGGSSTCTTSR